MNATHRKWHLVPAIVICLIKLQIKYMVSFKLYECDVFENDAQNMNNAGVHLCIQ